LLAWYDGRNYPLDRAAVRRALQSIVTKEGVRAHGSEVAWALWAAILLDIKLGSAVGRAVGRMNDDVVALVALHANSLGVISSVDVSRWSKHMTRAGLFDEHWLLAYEALHHSWLPSITGRDYTKGEPLFGLFQRNGVCFYDETAVLRPPSVAKNTPMPGHVGLSSTAEMTETHRSAIEAGFGELTRTGGDQKKERVVVVGPDERY
jgi:hypothetical protein